MPWEQFAGDYDTIRDAIAAVVPGCGDYNRKVRAPDGFQLLHGPAKDFMVVGYSTPVGNAAAYYPETNPLVPLDHTAARSNTPVSKAIVIRLERT